MDVYGFVSRLLALAAVTAAVLFITVCGEAGPEPTVPAEAEPAVTAAAPIREGEGEFANVLISTEGGVSLERAWLLVNNEPRASFAQGSVQIRVYDGDVLAVDCRAYRRELTFRVEILSASVEERYLPPRSSCKERVTNLGFVVMRQL